MRNLVVLSIIFYITFASCNKFEYNIYETNRYEKYEEVTTAYNLNRILQLPRKDTLRLAVFGDTQRFYNETEELVEELNTIPNLDAVIIVGDLTDFGVALEFDLINKHFMKLKVPFLTVIGNHDYLGNGTKLYQDIYGPLNYAFTWNNVRFVAHNTNSREVNFNGSVPDMNWINQQLIDTTNYHACVFFSHVPPFDNDFDRNLEQQYVQMLAQSKNTILSIHGHKHYYALDRNYDDGTWFLFPGNPFNRVYSLVSIYPNAQTNHFFDCTPVSF